MSVTELMMAQAVLSGAGALVQANAQASAANYAAEINMRNAEFAERRARDALLRGQEEENRVRAEGAQVAGRQRAGLAAAGLDLGFGSPLDILVDTATGIELDAARARRNAALEAEDFDRQAWSYRAQAGLDRAEARSARIGGVLGVVGAGIGGAGRVAQYRASIG